MEADLEIVEGVGLEHSEQSLLALLEAKLRVLGERAVDVAADHLIHILLPNADLEQCVVS